MQNEPELRNTGPPPCPLEVGGQWQYEQSTLPSCPHWREQRQKRASSGTSSHWGLAWLLPRRETEPVTLSSPNPRISLPHPPGGKGGTVSVSAGAASLVMNEVPGSIVCYFTVLCSEYPLHFAGPQTWPGVLRSGGAHRGNGIQSKWLLRVVRAVSECHSTWRKHIAVTPNPACGGQPQRSYSREGHWRWVCRIKTFQAEGTVWVDVWSSGNQRLSCVVFIFKFGNASQIFRGETL